MTISCKLLIIIYVLLNISERTVHGFAPFWSRFGKGSVLCAIPTEPKEPSTNDLLKELVTQVGKLGNDVARLGGEVAQLGDDVAQLRDDVVQLREETTKKFDGLQRMNSGYLEDSIRNIASKMFGESIMQRFLVKGVRDLVLISAPRDDSRDFSEDEEKLELFAKENFDTFVAAYYNHLVRTVKDPKVLIAKPWIGKDDKGNDVLVMENIKASGGALNRSQNELKSRILRVFDSKESSSSPFRTSRGLTLSIIVWASTGEFLNELEVDCRGKVDVLEATKRAVVMGAEIKTSASDIPGAKKQLLRRFNVIRKCLEIIANVEEKESIYIGRVFYRLTGEKNPDPITSEDGSNDDEFTTLSFYYHQL